MKKYTFIILPTIFKTTPVAPYNEVEHKKLNESLEKIRLNMMAKDIKEAFELAKEELSQLVAISFGEVPNIDNYLFRLQIIEISNY